MYQYLEHHGIKGMKWGVRRYRNKDGSLTEAGKKQFSRISGDGLDDAVNGRDVKYYKSAKSAAKSASETANNVRGMGSSVRSMQKRKAVQSIDTSKMSNKQLQDEITRMNLERNYKNLKAEQMISGRQNVEDVLSFGGSALAATATVLGIAVAVKQLS